MDPSPLSDMEFTGFRSLMRESAGIHLAPAKKAMVAGRLAKRLRVLGCQTYGAYLARLRADETERQTAIDLLTTNETYFFRESRHFAFLAEKVLPFLEAGRPFRVWSAACSSGEEPYSIAMRLAEHLGNQAWEVLASDLSSRVLERGRSGQYPLEEERKIPLAYLKAYCLKGIGGQEGTFMIQRWLRDRVRFRQINLNAPLPELGEYDVIFLRNVLIYFDMETKRQVCARLMTRLRTGGYLLVGHAETLNGVADDLQPVQPSVYRRG